MILLKTTFWTQLSCQFNMRIRVLAVIDYVMVYNVQKKGKKSIQQNQKYQTFFLLRIQ